MGPGHRKAMARRSPDPLAKLGTLTPTEAAMVRDMRILLCQPDAIIRVIRTERRRARRANKLRQARGA